MKIVQSGFLQDIQTFSFILFRMDALIYLVSHPLTIIMNWCGITLCCQFQIPYFNFSSFLIAYGSHNKPNKLLSFICNLLSFMFVTYRARCPITASSHFLIEGCWGVTSCCIKSNANREHGISGISSSLSPNMMQCPVWRGSSVL